MSQGIVVVQVLDILGGQHSLLCCGEEEVNRG
jgi:hypothetical protein